MPNYTWLRPREGDTADVLNTKHRAAQKLKALRSAFQAHAEAAALPQNTPPPTDASRFVRLATWNLREFDAPSYGWRSKEAKAYIAEIISQFDLVALQEIRRDLTALKDVMGLLGPSWDFIATDVTEGTSGNNERMAFLFNRDKVWFRHVAGELTLPDGQKVTDPFGDRFRIEGGARLELPAGQILKSPTGLKTDKLASGESKIEEDVDIPLPDSTRVVLPPGALIRFARNARVPLTADKGIAIEATDTPTLPEAVEIVLPPNSLVGGPQQFARTPFIVSFQSGWLKINLATVHIYYGSGNAGLAQRKEEIQRLTELLAQRARSDSDSDADAYFVVLGDFNIVNRQHETMAALLSNDFVTPQPLQTIPGSNVRQDKFYDQIALWMGKSKHRKTYTHLVPLRAGVFDFFDTVYRSDEEAIYHPFMRKPGSDEYYASYATWRTYQMSDHLPMWLELRIDFGGEYLDQVEADLHARLGG
jgi:endonuclease/exonuclease/phosphatase family metal-dependent hydrolase